ncbi:hypothetical protein P389DRAFT_196778 [Cystobasidium minutum MCA 4210]|uniref:uncharacterized protein n=1 Tax=Cystobasidium minutum MCA 4210 TaxID=1397322 RepID=UPI0034CD33F5|eukprot:jgi/Rhomi1/196778/gm1.4992_g
MSSNASQNNGTSKGAAKKNNFLPLTPVVSGKTTGRGAPPVPGSNFLPLTGPTRGGSAGSGTSTGGSSGSSAAGGGSIIYRMADPGGSSSHPNLNPSKK